MSELAIDDYGERIQALRPGLAHTVSIGSVMQASPAFGSGTSVIRVVATAACFLAFGAAPSASAATGHYLPQGVPEYFRVKGGERLAAIRATTDGQLHVSEMD